MEQFYSDEQRADNEMSELELAEMREREYTQELEFKSKYLQDQIDFYDDEQITSNQLEVALNVINELQQRNSQLEAQLEERCIEPISRSHSQSPQVRSQQCGKSTPTSSAYEPIGSHRSDTTGGPLQSSRFLSSEVASDGSASNPQSLSGGLTLPLSPPPKHPVPPLDLDLVHSRKPEGGPCGPLSGEATTTTKISSSHYRNGDGSGTYTSEHSPAQKMRNAVAQHQMEAAVQSGPVVSPCCGDDAEVSTGCTQCISMNRWLKLAIYVNQQRQLTIQSLKGRVAGLSQATRLITGPPHEKHGGTSWAVYIFPLVLLFTMADVMFGEGALGGIVYCCIRGGLVNLCLFINFAFKCFFRWCLSSGSNLEVSDCFFVPDIM
eukprot:Platyproteum_vivax@DN15970_c0_g1_i1.p1